MEDSLNISLPNPLRTYVEARVEAGNYGTPLNFVRDLIETDRRHRMELLQSRLIEAERQQPFDIPLDQIEEGSLVDFLRARRNESR
jgi:Arc/MetJ-type ribon-helix-helix transcriptional regulator